MKKIFARWVWRLSEFTGVGLGRFAPHVFGAMIGCKKNRKKEPDKQIDKTTRVLAIIIIAVSGLVGLWWYAIVHFMMKYW